MELREPADLHRLVARRALYFAACATPALDSSSPIAILASQVLESDIPYPDHSGVAEVDWVKGRPVRTKATVVADTIYVDGGTWQSVYGTSAKLVSDARKSLGLEGAPA